MDSRRQGHLRVGTSGFAYPDWAPRFYPPGLKAAALLPHYASRLPAVELNNTFYQQPTDAKVAAWLAATPDDFRFVVKAQRGGAWRALRSADVEETVGWLTTPYRRFGARLGCVLVAVDPSTQRDDAALARLLAAWPADVPVAFDLPHASWDADEVHAILRAHGAGLVATDADDREPPVLRRTGSFLYLRLRRSTITAEDLQAWQARLEPFLADGVDAWVFLRHDADGANGVLATTLASMAAGDGLPGG